MPDPKPLSSQSSSATPRPRRIWVRARLFWWSAIDPDEVTGMIDTNTVIARALTRDRCIEKARRRMEPKPSAWEEINL